MKGLAIVSTKKSPSFECVWSSGRAGYQEPAGGDEALHGARASEATPTILEYLRHVLALRDAEGVSNAEALAAAWLKSALDGNAAALKEILARVEPVEEAGPKTVKYIFERTGDLASEDRQD